MGANIQVWLTREFIAFKNMKSSNKKCNNRVLQGISTAGQSSPIPSNFCICSAQNRKVAHNRRCNIRSCRCISCRAAGDPRGRRSSGTRPRHRAVGHSIRHWIHHMNRHMIRRRIRRSILLYRPCNRNHQHSRIHSSHLRRRAYNQTHRIQTAVGIAAQHNSS